MEALLGTEGRRKLALRHKTNPELFTLYDSELILRIRNARNLDNDRRLLAKFHQYLNSYPPSAELAKGFLVQYTSRKPRTLARYGATIKAFMKWYGEPMDDFRVKVPKTLPPYTKDSDVDKIRHAFKNKKTHKSTIVRETLLLDLGLSTGMRRGELADLEPKDIQYDFLIVHGKGGRERVIPLGVAIGQRLHNFIKGMKPNEKVFKLKATSIGNKIRLFAKKAEVDTFHTHTMRHKFATDLLERGANIKVVQELLGHAYLGTTETYLSIVNQGLRDAVNLLNGSPQRPQPAPSPGDGIMPVVYSRKQEN
ncbi:MAG: tyrosine-type recombinase/integrase [Dehalococcoidia bacterium]|nr:MAG: tyrosine-type recombinase/integrase [Dehalococcoidia bacterium]